jgi:F-type H+-transporting ATPase subunit epsilon
MSDTATLTVTITRIDEAVFEGQADSLVVPGSEGVLTVLPEHEPFISLLGEGTIHVEADGTVRDIPIEKGILEVSANQATVLI